MHQRLVITALLLFAMAWAAIPVRASEVKLAEIPLSLYNKPVTGYRLTLDRSQRFVEQQIIKHVAEADAMKPFQYERTLIYENIRYRPIAADKDISLYYLMRGFENHYTELTLVVMHDYRQSISSRDFPELSLRVQIDLARLVRKTCGDVLRVGDVLFDDGTIQKLASSAPAAKAPPIQPGLGEEETERHAVVDPRRNFHESTGHGDGGNPDSTIAALRMRVSELEQREELLVQNEAKLRAQQGDQSQRQAALQAKIAENKVLKDSLTILSQRVQAMLGQYYVSDDASISSETAERIASLEREGKRQQKLIVRLEHENDSLQALSASNARQSEALSKGRQGMLDDMEQLRKDNSALQLQVNQLRDDLDGMAGAKSAESSADSLMVQLKAANRKNAAQQQEMEAVRLEQKRLLGENERILRSSERLEERISALESENRSLIAQQPNPSIPTLGGNANASADRDSLIRMRQRIDYLEQRGAEAAQKEKQIQDLNNTLRLKETEARGLQGKLNETQGKLDASIAERKQLEQQMGGRSASLKAAQEASVAAKAEQQRLEKERSSLLERLSKSESQVAKNSAVQKTLSDSILALNKSIGDLDGKIQGRDATIRSEIAQRDSLQRQLNIGIEREQELRRKSTELQARLDSLGRFTKPETEQQRFIRDQWSKLTDWEKQLESREKSTTDQEKLSGQRASTLDNREKDIKARELAILNLEERERQVRLREQQLDARESIGGSNVNPAEVGLTRITEFGSNVPVFTLKAELSYRAAQKQVVAYMLSRDVLLSEQFPDLVFRNAFLSELSEGQVEMKVRVESQGAASLLQISFKLPDGNYIGADGAARINESARQLIVRMLRYKN